MPPLHSSSEGDRPFNPSYQDFHYDSTVQQDPQEQLAPESTSIDRDDELLSFQPTTYPFALLDSSLQRTSLSLNARLHGMFFMADPPSALGPFPSMAPPELTCYRRNLFQVTGSIMLPRTLRYILTERGDRIPIVAQELIISATESVEGGTVKLISVPWKTPINSPPIPPEDKAEKEPTVIPVDLMSHHDPGVEFVTCPFAWKRLQFRIATANNGRRKELQQHFVARLKLVATLSSGDRVTIAEARSAAIVVRGRSPRNFQQRKDLPVGERATGRKGTGLPTNVGRRTGSDPPKPTPSLKRERSPDTPFPSFNPGNIPSAQDMHHYWTRPNGGSNSAPAFPTPTFKTPTLPSSKSPSSASPPPSSSSIKTQRIPHPHPDEPDPKRIRQALSNTSPRLSASTLPAQGHQPYKFSSLPPTLPSSSTPSSSSSTRQQQRPSSTHASPPAITTLPETITSANTLFYNYLPAVTQPWLPPFSAAAVTSSQSGLNALYAAPPPYLQHHPSSLTTSAIDVAGVRAGGGGNVLRDVAMK